MSTSARIGFTNPDNTIITAYCHWDGYPGGLGFNLCENWKNPEKVLEAIALGDALKWRYFVGQKIDFDDRTAGGYQNTYYVRDSWVCFDVEPTVFADEQTYLKRGWNSGEEFIYLMRQERTKKWNKEIGVWYYTDRPSNSFQRLEPTAMRKRINIIEGYVHKLEKENKNEI